MHRIDCSTIRLPYRRSNFLEVTLTVHIYLKDGHGATSIFKNSNMNQYSAKYIIAILNKTMDGKFDYDTKATKLKQEDIMAKKL